MWVFDYKARSLLFHITQMVLVAALDLLKFFVLYIKKGWDGHWTEKNGVWCPFLFFIYCESYAMPIWNSSLVWHWLCSFIQCHWISALQHIAIVWHLLEAPCPAVFCTGESEILAVFDPRGQPLLNLLTRQIVWRAGLGGGGCLQL